MDNSVKRVAFEMQKARFWDGLAEVGELTEGEKAVLAKIKDMLGAKIAVRHQVVDQQPVEVVDQRRLGSCEYIKKNGERCARGCYGSDVVDGHHSWRCVKHRESTLRHQCQFMSKKGQCAKNAQRKYDVDGHVEYRCHAHTPAYISAHREKMRMRYIK